MYLEHELSNVLPLLSDQYSENEIQEALSKKYEENPGWAIYTAGSNYSAVAQELIQDYLNYPPVHAALSEEQKAYTNEGMTVLDNCMGSGSTGVACVNTNHNFIGYELQPEYFEIAQKRINNAKEKRKIS